jgi:hypothetical protein
MPSPSDPVGFRPGSMHSIVYMLILTRKGLERFQLLQNDWGGFCCEHSGSKGQKSSGWNGASYFSGIRRGWKRFWSVSTNPQLL